MADRYRVANGNWNDTACWSTTSGGPGGASVPTADDDVYFDSNTPTGTHTINVTAYAKSINFTGFSGTLSGIATLYVYGDVTLSSTMTNNWIGNLCFAGSGTMNLTTNGKALDRIRINNSAGTVVLQDNLTLSRNTLSGTTSANIYLQAGSFNANGKDVILTGINSSLHGNLTFYNLIKEHSSANAYRLYLYSNITISNIFRVKGSSPTSRIIIRSDTIGTRRTITANSVDLAWVDFQDIAGAGSANWNLSSITGGSGDCGGNSGITFTTPMTCYYVGGAANGNWSDATKWRTTSGGSTQARVPLPQDTAIIDANSFSGSRTLTFDIYRASSVDFTGSSGVTFSLGSTPRSFYGSFNLTNLGNISSSGALDFYGVHGNSIICAGKSFGSSGAFFYKGTFVLQDDFSHTGNFGLFNSPTITANANVSTGYLTGTTGTLNMGSGIWTLSSGTDNPWSFSGSLNCGTSTIKITGNFTADRTFDGYDRTFYNLSIEQTGNYALIISGNNTFNKVTILPGRSVKFSAGTTQNIANFEANALGQSQITLNSTSSTRATLNKTGGGIVRVYNCYIANLNATPSNTWYAYNSVDGGNNNGWIFGSVYTKTFTANAILLPSATAKTFSADALLKRAQTKTAVADALLKQTSTKSFTADGLLKKSNTKQVIADAVLIGKPIIISPKNNQQVTSPVELKFSSTLLSDGNKNKHFELQVDKTNHEFNDIELEANSIEDNTNWEYWNGSSWVTLPSEGLDPAYFGTNVRYISSLTTGTKYWRVREIITV